MERLISLAEEPARQPGSVGAKAAGLARALEAGFPVLGGWVVPCAESAVAIRAGVEALDRSGPSAATLAISDGRLDPALDRDLGRVGSLLEGTLVVRSSTPLDEDGRWSGAFATYHDVDPEHLPVGVRGCWASAFTKDVIERSVAAGVAPDALRIGVLLQPWVRFDAGGTARLEPDGRVSIAATAAGPDTLVSGRRSGVLAEVSADGTVHMGAGLDGLTPRWAIEAGRLVRDLASTIDADAIEWGWADDGILLLQARRLPVPSASPAPSITTITSRAMPQGAERLAATVRRYPAPLGDELVIPWVYAALDVPEARAIPTPDPVAALAEARSLADGLTGQVWRSPPHVAFRAAEARARSLLGAEPEAWPASLSERCDPPHPGTVRRILGLVEGIGEALEQTGVLPDARLVWRLSVRELERAAREGSRPPIRRGPDRWEPFVVDVVRWAGAASEGTAVCPGIGAGIVSVVDGSVSATPGPRAVLAVSQPLPQLAPLLWNSAGLVAASGSPGAHLFEVARSLGVPAVVGVHLAGLDGALATVDGCNGIVTVTDPARSSTRIGGVGA
ncbi:MAG: PEP-utilizing enzyme [Actinomycetota bacterium]